MLEKLPGPTICGLYGVFEVDYGDPSTDPAHVRVTPSTLAGITLPFRCPGCRRALWQFSQPATREDYHDTRPGRDNHWCPLCGQRFTLVLPGEPLPDGAKISGSAAPSRVERLGQRATVQDDRKEISDVGYLTGTAVLGSGV